MVKEVFVTFSIGSFVLDFGKTHAQNPKHSMFVICTNRMIIVIDSARESIDSLNRGISFYSKGLVRIQSLHRPQHSPYRLAYERKGDPERAIRYHEKSLIIYKAVYGDKHQDVGATHNNLGNVSVGHFKIPLWTLTH